MNESHHDTPDRRSTPEENQRLDLVLEVFAWAAFLVFAWYAVGFTLRAFLG